MICEHDCMKLKCKKCNPQYGGRDICKHNWIQMRCKECALCGSTGPHICIGCYEINFHCEHGEYLQCRDCMENPIPGPLKPKRKMKFVKFILKKAKKLKTELIIGVILLTFYFFILSNRLLISASIIEWIFQFSFAYYLFCLWKRITRI